MGQLIGLKDYIKKEYDNSIFNYALDSQEFWEIHLHDNLIVQAKICADSVYDFSIQVQDKEKQDLQKHQVKLIYEAKLSEPVRKLIKYDKKVKKLKISPILNPINRHFVKNKTLFTLMKEKTVVFFTLLEGEIIRGLIADFTKYDITVSLKGGIPVTILRHSIYDLKDKQGVCFLKKVQQKAQNWKKSKLYVD